MIWGGVKRVTRNYSKMKELWHESPEFTVSIIIFTIGFFGAIHAGYLNSKKEVHMKKFQNKYTVYRPDDPRCKYIPEIKFPEASTYS